MTGWEKIIAPIILPLAWMGSFEVRLRSKVSHKTFDQNREDINRRLGRGVERFDKIDKTLDKHSELLTKIDTKMELLVNGKE